MPNMGALDVVRRARANGVGDVSRRIVRRVSTHLARQFRTSELDFPLLEQDIADSGRLVLDPPPVRERRETQLKIAWLCTPPGPGSGGHTTLFRMVAGMEQRGHRCTLLLYDRHGTDIGRAAAIIRANWPWLRAEIALIPGDIEGFDCCVASSWETAHVLASRSPSATHRFYFIQDFEPYFYPRGSLYSLAEDSYRFGFRNIALGAMVATTLRENAGVESTCVPFGCDTETYGLQNLTLREGVVFYARESVDRRGFLLAKLALEEFHERHPGQTIHIYGDPVGAWQTPHIHHGRLSPRQLCQLYNSCLAGLALSFTNISLVAEEMLACGTIPVVNDHPFARMDLPSPYARWAPPTPGGLAEALHACVDEHRTATFTADMSATVRQGWGHAQASFADVVEAEVGHA